MNDAPMPQAPTSDAPDAAAADPSTSTLARSTMLLIAWCVISTLATAYLWFKLSHIQETLARQSQEAATVSLEAKTLAKSAQDSARETAGRQAMMEAKISEVALQRTQLEELMQSLSRSRDENLVVDIESAIRLAQQQAQLTGSTEPLLAALKSADLRLSRAAQPRLNPLQRAIAKDTARIRAAAPSDTPGLLVKLDELARLADDLPLANGLPRNGPAGRTGAAGGAPEAKKSTLMEANAKENTKVGDKESDKNSAKDIPFSSAANRFLSPDGMQSLWARALEQARSLVRVSRINAPEAALLSPEQGFFVRENFKLKILNARLGLLARQLESSRADLGAANATLGRYFDTSARSTQQALGLLAQVQQQMRSLELPRLDDTTTALATAAAGR